MNEIQMIQNFITQYNDFGSYSNEQYKAVYRPSWHPEPISFWFNPPFDEDGESNPSPSGTLILCYDGSILIENYDNGQYYKLNECLGDTILNAVYAINSK